MRIDVSEKGSAHPETYRACMACYQRDRTSGAERPEVDVVGENAILYHTRTLCVPCSITERRGYDPVPAIVVQRGDTVYLERNCPVHGLLSTEYCRSATFFREAITFAAGVPGDPFDADLDALASEIKSNRSSLPLVVELPVTTGSGQLLSKSLVDMRLRKIENLFPSELSFILDIKGGALPSFSHVAQLNALLLHIEQVTRRCLIIVDLAYDRLIDFAHIPNSALLKGRIFPGVRYHLVRGEEETAVAELTQLITTMRDFSRIQLIFTLSFDRPFPSLASVLGLVRQHRDIIKFVVLSPERSTRELLATASKSHMTYDAAGGSVDPVELIDLVCQDVGYGLTRSDFIPASVLQCLEPLLSLMGYGQYSMRISSLCGFICPLQFGTGSSITPVARVIDSRRLLKTVSSLSDALRPRTIPVLALNRLRNELLSCTLSGTIMQDILTSLASIDSGESSSANQRLAEFVSSLQFIIVDNKMDIASMDLRRRARCPVATLCVTGSTQAFAASSSEGCF
ncbi:hypothetical protein PBRA_002661 [Plasmodiophora brassicae]|nr:hypothetical protein PBRA_002661 [Plasmodiophora brassicae]